MEQGRQVRGEEVGGGGGEPDPSFGIRLQNGFAFFQFCCHIMAGWTPFEG